VKVLIAKMEEVAALLPMDEAIDVMASALRLLAEGDALLPLRTILALPAGERLMGLMPSYLGGIEALGVTVISVFPANQGPSTTHTRGWCCTLTPSEGCCKRLGMS
jgi:ornithine cyclodeaminase